MTEPMTVERRAEIRERITRARAEVAQVPGKGWFAPGPGEENSSAALINSGLDSGDELLAEVERLRALWADVAKIARNRKAETDGRRQHAEKLEAENEQLRKERDDARACVRSLMDESLYDSLAEAVEFQAARGEQFRTAWWSARIRAAKAQGVAVRAIQLMNQAGAERDQALVDLETALTERDLLKVAAQAETRAANQWRAEAKVASLLHDIATVARHIEDSEYGDADQAARQALGIAPGVDLPGRES